MKTTIQIILSTLLFTVVHAETVHVSNLTVDNVEVYLPNAQTPGEYGSQFDTGNQVELWDARGISSVTVQPYFHAYIGQLQPVLWDFSFTIRYWDSTHHSHDWNTANDPLVTVPFETWIDFDGNPLSAPFAITLNAQIMDEFGPPANSEYRWAHVNEAQVWTYGFNVLSYEVVPEPDVVQLVIFGVALMLVVLGLKGCLSRK